MQRRRRDCVLLFVGLLRLIIITHSATVTIPVGVILDSDSSLGSMVLNCTNISLHEFYSRYDSYTTKLQLHFRDSGDDLPTAASAAWDLINNEKVHVIVGPQNSEQARYVVKLGNESDVPVVWFSPSGPSLLPPRSPFSIHSNSSRSHCFQFKAIAAIIEAYSWQCVIPIYEEPEFGNDLIPCLTYALQDMDTRVPYTSAIRQDFTNSQFTEELNKIKGMGTCVFVAHMSVELWSRLVKSAKDAWMMSEGYAWILTQGLSSVIDPEAKDNVKEFMDGALGVRPSLDLSSRTKRHSLAETLRDEYGKTLSIYGLWAYDTITALAYAVENTSLVNYNESRVDLRYKPDPEFRKAIQDTNFIGLSGNFSLRKGQLEPSQIEYNVKGQKEIIIGHWSPETGLELFQNHSEVDELIWPGGNTTETPVNLKIGVPKTHFTEFVNVTVQGQKISATGLAAEVFKKVVAVLPFKLAYEFVPVTTNISGELSPSSYDDLLCNITSSKNIDVDVIIGDITTLVSRTNCVDFTLPYLDSSVSMVVKVRSDSKSMWILFKPFDLYLWLILGGIFVIATVTVIILEEIKKNEANSELKRNPFLIYMSDVESLKDDTSKWVVIVVTFLLGLILQVYTANLTSILTEKTMAKTSPWKDVQEIKRNPGSVGYQNDSWVRGLLIDQIGFDPNKLISFANLEDYNKALTKGTKEGGVDAIFDETPYLMLLLSKCSSCKMTGPIYKAGGFAFAFRKDSTLVSSFSAAILNVTQNVTTFRDMKKNISLPITIDKSEYSSDVEMRTLTKDDFGGLFPMALFVLILFFSFTILKVPSVALRLRSSLPNNRVPSPPLWLHNKLVSHLGGSPTT